MNDKIHIDQLFKDGLQKGKEQLNLSAWANMERMLDGKNPYADNKSKRRFLPFWLFLGLLTTVSSTAIIYNFNQKEQKHALVDKPQLALSNPISNKIASSENQIANNTASVQSSLDKENYNPSINIINDQNELATAKKSAQTKKATRNYTSKAAYQNDEAFTSVGSPKKAKTNNENKLFENVKNSEISENKIEPNHTAVSNNTSKESIKKSLPSPVLNNQENSVTTITTTKNDTFNQTFIKEEIVYDRLGNVQSVNYETTKKDIHVVETIQERDAVENPRYVALNEQEKMDVLKTIDLKANHFEAPIEPSNTTSNNSISEEKNKKETKHNSLLEKSIAALGIAATSVAHMYIPLNPGVKVGINASFGKHSFGGFQAGITNRIPLSNTFTLLNELNFFYKNNSGYSVNNITKQLNNVSSDPNTLATQNQTIHTYQVDSNNRIYNFKNLTSLELPIILEGHWNKISAYGGVNIAYLFRLNTKQSLRTHIIEKTDTLSNSVPFNYINYAGQQYISSDFNARFGLGYILGTAYHFNDNLHVDFRLSQTLWDNTKTNSAREISNVLFKVPSVQISLGYKFSKKEKH
ncbi:MAG: hypothetical protein R2831_05265 [Chitinophagaceae bacterium]